MEARNVGCLLILLFAVSCCYVTAIRTKDKIYVNIFGQKACFRRLNATHQIGCSSESKGNIGVIHYVKDQRDIDWILNKGPHAPYVMLIGALDFNRQNITKLIDSKKVTGILVIETNGTAQLPPDGFSSDKSCPNDGYGLYYNNTEYKHCNSVEWNPPGKGMMFQDYNIPIFLLVDPKEVEYIIKSCYEKYNSPENESSHHYPLCAAELKDFMNAAKDSVTCMRRSSHLTTLTTSMTRYCDPLSNYNVVGFVNPKTEGDELPEKSIIIAGSRMDYMSMFEGVNRSADNPVTSIVALLAAAEAIGKVKDEIVSSPLNKTILFTFFQGEAYDYIGSSRMVYDMEMGKFPKPLHRAEGAYKHDLHQIRLNHLSHFLEVNQLGYRDDKHKVWLHTDPISHNSSNISSEIHDLVEKIKKIGKELHVDVGEPSRSVPLPPSSLHRFLRRTQLPAVMFSNHEKEYTNIYYNSMFDLGELIGVPENPEDISQEMLTNVSTVLARTLYQLATGKNGSHIFVNSTTVNQLMYCYIWNSKCPMFHMVISKERSDKYMKLPAMNLYAGVKDTLNPLTMFTERLLAYYLGDSENVSESNCRKMTDGISTANWMQGESKQGICVLSPTRLTDAISPAFVIEDYDWLSGEYSTWTESTWRSNAMSVRVFLIPSNKLQAVTLFVGVFILCLSMGIVYFMNSRAEVIFSATPVYPVLDG